MKALIYIRKATIFLAFLIIMLWTNVGIAQVDWEKYSGNPVLDVGLPGSWDSFGLSSSHVHFSDGSYRMWYCGENAPFGHLRIGYATSTDGINWMKYPGNPVLDVGPPGSWDDHGVVSVWIIKAGSEYKTWYTGTTWTTCRIGYATSADGIHWAKYPGNPVLKLGPPGSWDDRHVKFPIVIFDGSVYKMWYIGNKWTGDIRSGVGYATSTDGINWVKYPGNPVMLPDEAWDNCIECPTIILDDGVYRMWYGGLSGKIGYATSIDGINWVKYPGNPVMLPGPGAWDNSFISHPFVLRSRAEYKMWYGGSDGANWRIGYATSTVPLVSATIDLDPDTLNLKSKGGWITCYIELPEYLDVNDIDISTVMLEDTIPAEQEPTEIGDRDADGIPDLMVKFDRQALIAYMGGATGDVVLKVMGEVSGTPFQGEDTIKVVSPGRTAPAQHIISRAYAPYPQPSNPGVWIPYALGQDAEVSVSIYNANGVLVRILNLGCQNRGVYISKDKAAYWDGANESGEKVASGIYFCTVKAGEFAATERMVIQE